MKLNSILHCKINSIIKYIIPFFVCLPILLLPITKQYYWVQLLFAICITTCVYGCILYVFDLKHIGIKDKILSNRYSLSIIIIGVFIFMPLLTDSFYFHDDYWGFTGEKTNAIPSGVGLGRIFQGFLAELFSFVSSNNTYYIRWFTVLFAIIFCLLLYKWIEGKSNKKLFSFLLSMIICYSSIMGDCTSYASILSYTFGIAMAAFSVIAMEGALYNLKYNSKIKGICLILICAMMIFGTYHSYQLAIPIIFLMFAINVYYSKDRNIIISFSIIYLIILVIVSLIYLLSNKWISQAIGINVSNRSDTIDGIQSLIYKICWFIGSVIPKTIDRIIAILGGKAIFLDKNYWYVLQYRNLGSLITLFKLVVYLMILWGIGSCYYKKKSLVEVAILIFCIPASYFVHLLLRENGYLTYYAFPLIGLLIFYIGIGIESFFSILKEKFHLKENYAIYMLALICIISSAQSNTYLRQFWIGENKKSFDYMQTVIKSNLEKRDYNNIHIYGTPNPGQANVYSQFATNIVLKEMGRDPKDYNITVSDNIYYMSVIEKDIFEEGCSQLSSKEIEKLKSYYSYGETYSQYYITRYNFNKQELEELQYLSTKAKLLPSNYRDVLIVDLTWVTSIW